MEAKDTIIPGRYSPKELDYAINQAEITFKAGYDEGLIDKRAFDTDIAYKIGLSEVVDWIENRKLHPCSYCSFEYRFDEDDWQAFKKSKGIK